MGATLLQPVGYEPRSSGDRRHAEPRESWQRTGGTRHDEANVMLPTLATDVLAAVTGGREIPAFGRCGPGDRWGWLGDVYTPECAAHDAAVRGALANGSSRLGAQLRGLPLLPAAASSYVRARLGR